MAEQSNWANATEALLAQLACPRCDAENTPHVHRILMHDGGHANCKQCGYGAHVQEFMPQYMFRRKERPAC